METGELNPPPKIEGGHVTIGALLGAASLAISAALYARLPDPMPTHWNLRGEADGFVAKPLGPFVGPLMLGGMVLFFAVLPAISPRGYRIERFGRVYSTIATLVACFLFVVIELGVLFALGVPVARGRAMVVVMGALFVVLGNLMGKVTRNFFVGVRTPWTLASDEVWLQTHRTAGKIWVVAGLAAMGAGLLGAPPLSLILILTPAALIPIVHSYVLYRRIEGPGGD